MQKIYADIDKHKLFISKMFSSSEQFVLCLRSLLRQVDTIPSYDLILPVASRLGKPFEQSPNTTCITRELLKQVEAHGLLRSFDLRYGDIYPALSKARVAELFSRLQRCVQGLECHYKASLGLQVPHGHKVSAAKLQKELNTSHLLILSILSLAATASGCLDIGVQFLEPVLRYARQYNLSGSADAETTLHLVVQALDDLQAPDWKYFLLDRNMFARGKGSARHKLWTEIKMHESTWCLRSLWFHRQMMASTPAYDSGRRVEVTAARQNIRKICFEIVSRYESGQELSNAYAAWLMPDALWELLYLYSEDLSVSSTVYCDREACQDRPYHPGTNHGDREPYQGPHPYPSNVHTDMSTVINVLHAYILWSIGKVSEATSNRTQLVNR